ncbi:uncharacterized protein EV422DRAFT_146234 [Fimicolochytrium jonesii]|uniref:uncharacterized protein n=1 Tax=Fimicolochytrium jonesii TaxID=1396493 RepID=UPI0022FE29CF|nr:uncharacterized protein EV422DRAFT_146234 [Fimicolochytrium jonesii]KAI8825929.1 hypothetical protein EV422DRAFT_146234 [Fimicolochytrium jonesii]
MNSDRPSEDDDATQILPSASQTTAQSPPAADAVPIPAEVNPTSAIPDLRKALRTYGSNRSKHDERTPTVERSFPDLDDFDFADPEVRKDVASAERPLSTENAVATNNMDHAGGVLSPSDNGDGDYEDEDVPSYSRKRGRVGAMKRRIAASGLQDDEEPEGQEETEAPPETNVSDVQRKDLIREKLRAMAAREREKLEQSQRGARNSELSGDEGPVEEPHAVPAEDQIDAHAQLPEGLFEELSGDDAAAASDGDEEDDGMRDSDGNLLDEEPSVPISAPKKRLKKSLNQKEKLELKKQTEALLRSAEIELPKRQGKFTMDNFLASRGIVRKPGRVESVPEVTSPGGMVTAAVPNPAEATTIKTESPARPSPRKNLPLKSDKVVSRSEFADMQKANAALSRQLMMNIELADDDAALSVDDEDDADALEIIDVLAEPNIKEEGQKHNPFAYAAKPTKKALLNRELMHKNQVLARQRRVMEEEAARAAEEARKKRREEKKAERHAVKVEAGPKTDGERKTDADADHDEDDIVEMHVGSQEPPADTNGDETDNERKNENGEHGRPLVRRLFSDLDRTPFAVLFSKPEQDDSDDDDALDRDRERRKMPSERVRVGEDEDDEDNDGFDDNEDITLEPKPPSEYTQSVRLPAPISLQYSYSLDMDPPEYVWQCW